MLWPGLAIMAVYDDICEAFSELDFEAVLEHFADEGMVKISQGGGMWGFSAISRFLRTEDGTATVEFVIVFPIIIIIFVAAFETAMLLTRQV